MSKASQLKVLENDISVPGCHFTKTALILDTINEETLLHAGTLLNEVEECREWWWGDYLLYQCELRLSQESNSLRDEARRDPRVRTRLFRRYTAEREDVTKLHIVSQHQLRDTSDFYSPERRRYELSNQHHQEAMDVGDKAVADDWLDKAAKHNWTTPQLRAAIRQAKRAAVEPDEPMVEHTQAELFACARWARTTTKRVADMDEDEARQLYVDLQPILTLAEQLSARLGGKSVQVVGRPSHD